jgi:hypothetical protein
MAGLNINKIVMKAAREAAEKRLEELQSSGQILDPEKLNSENPDQIPSPDSQAKKAFSSFLSSEGYYAIIYKIKPDGGWELKDYKIDACEAIPDGSVELEVSRIVKEKGWGSGRYIIQVHQKGGKGFKWTKWITIAEPTPIEKAQDAAYNQAIPIQRSSIGELRETIQTMKEMLPPPTPAKDIIDAIEKGRSWATPSPSGGNGQDSQISVILQIVSAVKDLFPKAQPADVDTIIEKVVARLTPLQPKEDFFQSLIKYQEAMNKLNPPEKREREIDSIKKVTDIVQAIRPLTGGGAGEPPSWGQLLLEHGSKLIEPIISTFKEFAEAKKMEMQLRMENIRNPSALVPNQPNPKPEIGGPKLMHPFVVRTLKAVNENDESYFESLRQRIYAMGPHFIEGLVTGELTSDFAIEIANEVYGLPVDNEKVKPYFDKFVQWLRGGTVKSVPEIKGNILAQCKSCHQEYDFKDMDEWMRDNKVCEDCQGELELAKEQLS